MQNMPPVDQIHPPRKQPVLFYLLAGGTGLLLAWLSVGLAPSTWWLLFQVISQFKMLWMQHGISTLWALLLLIGQSLLLLGAWVLLIGVVARESTRIHALLPASAVATAAVVPVPDPMLEMPISPSAPVMPVSRLQPAQGAAASAHPGPPTQRTRTPASPVQSDQVKVHDTLPPTQILQGARAAQTERTKRTSEKAARTNPSSSPDILRSSAQKASDPYAVSNIVDQEEQIPFPDLPQAQEVQKKQNKRSKWQNDDVPSDPFALNEDILRMSLQSTPLQEAGGHLEQAQPAQPTSLDDDQDEIFVFGNPFDGALPDVFEHDEDLKRSLIEQSSESQPDPATSSQPRLDDMGKLPRQKKRE